MSPSNCTNGVDHVEVLQTYLPGTQPPPRTQYRAQLEELIASQDASAAVPSAVPSTVPSTATSSFPANASLAITVDLGVNINIIQVVPTLLTPPPLREITSYTSDPTEILRFEAGQLVFRTRLAAALSQDMASRAPTTNQQNFKTQIDAVNQSMAHTLKLVNDLSLSINGDFSIPPNLMVPWTPSHPGQNGQQQAPSQNA